MLTHDENHKIQDNLKDLQNFIFNSRDIRERTRGKAVRLKLLGLSNQEIKNILGVSTSFITDSQRKYTERGVAGLKVRHKKQQIYLTDEEKEEISGWLHDL
ncbi:helix-turn-helix domain-containing protein [Symplocastrum sp. BBK-W-15]|uniref:Helix-turn-helix domain-containing protein n=2 Tax=Limnofasciculus TaxID=3064905 RepID=A0AAE3KQA9_9CYAN|nr:helix-turn-helix domain-containing protein [Limnofasciculus baicalensis BBK-W-15]